MTLWAVIPAKDPAQAKSRLARAFTPEQRRTISLGLLERTLQVLRQVPAVTHTLVVSAADEPRALAYRHGAQALQEGEHAPIHAPGAQLRDRSGAIEDRLNAALRQAAATAVARGADAVLVLPADLPCLTPTALMALIDSLPAGPGVVLAPDRHHSGTNALLVAPPAALPFSFGKESFARHRDLAARRGVSPVIFDHPAFALDLDTPEDVEALTALLPAGHWTKPDDFSTAQGLQAMLNDADPVAAAEHCA